MEHRYHFYINRYIGPLGITIADNVRYVLDGQTVPIITQIATKVRFYVPRLFKVDYGN
jgi:hypothetical protein